MISLKYNDYTLETEIVKFGIFEGLISFLIVKNKGLVKIKLMKH